MTEKIRKQSLIVQSGLKKKVCGILLILALFTLAEVGFLIVEKGIYIPPKAESNALEGIPEPEEHFMYGTLETDYGFTFSIATNLYQQEDGSVFVYFTNYKENKVKMMCEIVHAETGKTYYKSGVITPGQYVEALTPVTSFPNEAFKAQIMIYSFEEDSWYSGGTVEIAAMVQGW